MLSYIFPLLTEQMNCLVAYGEREIVVKFYCAPPSPSQTLPPPTYHLYVMLKKREKRVGFSLHMTTIVRDRVELRKWLRD